MNFSVKRDVPEFISEYLIFCNSFTDLNKLKTCIVLTRNLKLFEFHQKELVASIDLSTTCLIKHKQDLQKYEGPKGNYYDISPIDDPGNSTIVDAKGSNAKPITLGKYVFHALDIYKVYILVKCWDKCVVVRRLPDFTGFKIEVEYENLLSYRITHGSLKFCPVVEFQFQASLLKTDFEEKSTKKLVGLNNKSMEMEQLLERVRNAKTELQLHKFITEQSFHTTQNNLTVGLPFLRSLKLEEKQMLNRCGDIWKRFSQHDDLIIGIPLVNQCASPNLSIIRNIMPVLKPTDFSQNICLQFRLFQLNLKFDQIDSLEMFLDTEDDQMQDNMWCLNEDLKILPESFVVLLVKFKISEIINLQKCPLVLNYEVKKYVHGSPDLINRHSTMPLQLYIQTLDFQKILFEERLKYKIGFTPETIHQDFLTIAMTSEETSIKIIFNTIQDMKIVENYIQTKLEFTKQPTTTKNDIKIEDIPFVLYNKNPNSLWFGSVILRKVDEIKEKQNEELSVTWKIYCSYLNKTLLLIKTFFNDVLTMQCNILSISYNRQNNFEFATNLQTALRLEIMQINKLLSVDKSSKNSEKILELLESLCHLQYNTDSLTRCLLEND